MRVIQRTNRPGHYHIDEIKYLDSTILNDESGTNEVRDLEFLEHFLEIFMENV